LIGQRGNLTLHLRQTGWWRQWVQWIWGRMLDPGGMWASPFKPSMITCQFLSSTGRNLQG
jgi:hypothetical protein